MSPNEMRLALAPHETWILAASYAALTAVAHPGMIPFEAGYEDEIPEDKAPSMDPF
ncbi:hypothetical protein G5B39_18385 (plasmid) [Rhodobacteraceae bacterium SC52]|nr:hypothetical protein G5B39_18385 [Rhodobacteraceae bacterium SC52]